MALFTFEWANEGDPFEGRFDEDVFSFEVSHGEGEFATLRVELRNPRVGLLTPDRFLWAWLGQDDGSSAGPEPLFFGRIVGVPESITDEVIQVQFIARPSDYDDQKAALAETLKERPFYDPIWINPTERNNPDVVLEARPAHWHIDRITHEVSISDIIEGEDGTVVLPADAMYANSLKMSYRETPATSISCEATVRWDQAAKGSIDLRTTIAAAFRAAGSPPGVATSYTGQGLQEDWPEKGDSIGAGWTVGEASALRIDGTQYPTVLLGVEMANARAGFPLWYLSPVFSADYEISRSRTEIIRFTITADVQPLTIDAGEDTGLNVSLSSQEVASLIDGDGTTDGSFAPIGDVRRPSYFTTDRGKQSLEYVIVMARARLIAKARAVSLSRDIAFDVATALSCRLSGTINDARLPDAGGTGKVISYSFGLNGDDGTTTGSVTLACTVGRGGSVSDTPGDPDYVASGYVQAGYQVTTGGATALAGGAVTYSDFAATPIDDDGVNLLGLDATTAVLSCVVVGGQTEQEAALAAGTFDDIGAAIEAVNAVATVVALDLLPLTGGPFQTEFAVTTSALKIPKTIDLETP